MAKDDGWSVCRHNDYGRTLYQMGYFFSPDGSESESSAQNSDSDQSFNLETESEDEFEMEDESDNAADNNLSNFTPSLPNEAFNTTTSHSEFSHDVKPILVGRESAPEFNHSAPTNDTLPMPTKTRNFHGN
jgi:hypothetical protein